MSSDLATSTPSESLQDSDFDDAHSGDSDSYDLDDEILAAEDENRSSDIVYAYVHQRTKENLDNGGMGDAGVAVKFGRAGAIFRHASGVPSRTHSAVWQCLSGRFSGQIGVPRLLRDIKKFGSPSATTATVSLTDVRRAVVLSQAEPIDPFDNLIFLSHELREDFVRDRLWQLSQGTMEQATGMSSAEEIKKCFEIKDSTEIVFLTDTLVAALSTAFRASISQSGLTVAEFIQATYSV